VKWPSRRKVPEKGESMFNREYLSFIAATLMSIASTGLCVAQQATSPPVKPEIREAWRKSMVRKALPKNGCFKAEYPSTEWQETQCGRPSPYLNYPCPSGVNVGGVCDYVAQASGSNLISWAEGSFLDIPGVTGVSGVSGDVAGTSTSVNDVFELQMNTQSQWNAINGFNPYPSTFSTPACSGAPNGAAGCYGWQQFLFSQTQGPAPTGSQQSVPGPRHYPRPVHRILASQLGIAVPSPADVGAHATRERKILDKRGDRLRF